MEKAAQNQPSPLALVLAASLAEVFFSWGYGAASAYPLRERIWGLGLALLGFWGLLALLSGRRPGGRRLYGALAGAAVLLALMRTLKEGWRFYTLYADEDSDLLIFGALALLAAGWGVYWGERAAYRAGSVALWLAAGAGVLVLFSLAGQCRITNLPDQPLEAGALAGAAGSALFFLPELLYWAEKGGRRPGFLAQSGRYLGTIWAAQSLLWVLAALIWQEEGGAFDAARLGLLSVFRRFDILYMPVLLLLFYSRLVLGALWLALLRRRLGLPASCLWWAGGLTLAGSAFLYSGSPENYLRGGEQALLWLAAVLYLMGPKTKKAG